MNQSQQKEKQKLAQNVENPAKNILISESQVMPEPSISEQAKVVVKPSAKVHKDLTAIEQQISKMDEDAERKLQALE